jgi:hypothetical protein
LSATNSVANWIKSGSTTTDPALKAQVQAFLNSLGTATGKKLDFSLPAANLPENAGSCEIVVQYTDTENKNLKITSTATYQGNTKTVSLKLVRSANENLDAQSPSLAGAAFDMTSFTAYESQLNGITPNITQQLGYNYSDTNATDQAKINAMNAAGVSNAEALWQNNLSTAAANTETHGTFSSDASGSGSALDNRQFLVPDNGRLTINPLKPGTRATSTAFSKTYSDANNTRISTFSVANPSGKDIMIRLGGNSLPGGTSQNTFYNALMAFDFTNYKKDIANNIMAVSNPYVRYYPNNIYTATPLNTYNPINWKSGTIFTQNTDAMPSGVGTAEKTVLNSGLTTRLVFGGFLHKYSDYIDYWGWGNYVANPTYGQTSGDFYKTNTQLNSSANNRLGMPYLPLYYNDFNLYLLDKGNDPNAMILQGVSILDGTIYSYRGMTLGTGCVKKNSTDGYMNNLVSSNVDGFDYLTYSAGNYWAYTLRWDQLIYNTDIILKNYPGEAEKYSYIRTPNSSADTTRVSNTQNANFHPTEKIIGGTIYVGTGQTLTIERGVTVQPEKVIVDGGTLIIRGSNSGDSYNLEAPVYVKNNGEMILEANTKIKADIYVYDGAFLQIASSVTWTNDYVPGPASFISSNAAKNISVTPFTADGGIFIFGPKSKDASGTLVGAGHLWNIKSTSGYLNSINMTDGKIHMLGGAFMNDINTRWAPIDEDYKTELTDATMDKVFCANRYLAPSAATPAAKFDDPSYNNCLDLGASVGLGAWKNEEYDDA